MSQFLVTRGKATDQREESVGHTLPHSNVVACAALEQSELEDHSEEWLEQMDDRHELVGLTHRMSAQHRYYGQTVALDFVAKPVGVMRLANRQSMLVIQFTLYLIIIILIIIIIVV